MPVATANVLGPTVVVTSACRCAASAYGRWRCTWSIQNLTQEPLHLLAAGLPHSRFQCEEQELSPAPKLLPGKSAHLTLAVAFHEPAGTVVENAFLILRVTVAGAAVADICTAAGRLRSRQRAGE